LAFGVAILAYSTTESDLANGRYANDPLRPQVALHGDRRCHRKYETNAIFITPVYSLESTANEHGSGQCQLRFELGKIETANLKSTG
jgi:hypothetical protein